MPADQLAVFREGHVAFDHTGAHAGRGHVTFPAVFGELQRRTAMADRKTGAVKRSGALAELLLQRPVLHLVDEVKRPRSDLRLLRQRNRLRRGGKDRGHEPECGQHGGTGTGRHGWYLRRRNCVSSDALRAAIISWSM